MQFGVPVTGTGIVKSTNGILDAAVSKVVLTEPATSATLTIANGKTLTANNSIAFTGTDGTTITLPTTSATMARTDAAQTFTGTQSFLGVVQAPNYYINANSGRLLFGVSSDVMLLRKAAANLQQGAADAAAPVAQTSSVQSVAAGTSNTAGVTRTYSASQGTGTGVGGSHVFQVAPAGAPGTAQNALAPAFTINGDGSSAFVYAVTAPTFNGVTLATTETLFLKAADFIPRTTSGCGINSTESTTNKINLDVLEFDAAAIEYAQLDTVLPKEWNAGTITAKFHWTAASGSGDVVWAIQAVALANDDAIDTAFGTAQSATDTLTAVSDLDISPATSAFAVGGTPAAGNHVVFQVYRDATNGSDTLAVDAQLIGVTLTYTKA
jgi:hypothetical protein